MHTYADPAKPLTPRQQFEGSVQAGLITPGIERKKLEKAAASSGDLFHIELEDGVPNDRKAEAREIVRDGLQTLPWGDRLTMVRVNPVDSGMLEDDIDAVVPGQPTAFILAKCQGPEDIRYLDHLITRAELKHGVEPGKIRIVSMIERIRALNMADEIAVASPRMMALYIGPADLGTEVGYHRSYEGIELETYYPKAKVIIAAHSAGLLAFDSGTAKFRDLDLTYTQAAWAARIGFDAKMGISPNQIETVRRAFTPSEEDVAWAESVLAGKDAALSSGGSVWQSDGMFLDEAMVGRAEKIMKLIQRQRAREHAVGQH